MSVKRESTVHGPLSVAGDFSRDKLLRFRRKSSILMTQVNGYTCCIMRGQQNSNVYKGMDLVLYSANVQVIVVIVFCLSFINNGLIYIRVGVEFLRRISRDALAVVVLSD